MHGPDFIPVTDLIGAQKVVDVGVLIAQAARVLRKGSGFSNVQQAQLCDLMSDLENARIPS